MIALGWKNVVIDGKIERHFLHIHTVYSHVVGRHRTKKFECEFLCGLRGNIIMFYNDEFDICYFCKNHPKYVMRYSLEHGKWGGN